MAGERALVREQRGDGARVDHLSPVLARAGADVDHPVRRANGVFVVLDDDERVAEVAEPRERLDEPAVVALVEADARLVEHVEHSNEARADLGREANALRLAAAEGCGPAGEREVVEANVEQEAQPRVDLLEHLHGDLLAALVELGVREERARDPDRHLADLGDGLAANRDREHLWLEASAVAARARHLAHVGLVLLARPLGFGLVVEALEPRDGALEAGGVLAFAAVAILESHVHLVVVAAQHRLLGLLRERVPRIVHREAEVVGQRLERAREVVGRHCGPRRDGALREAQLGIWDHEVWVDLELDADAGAFGARAIRRVEREGTRLHLLEREHVVVGARALLAVAARRGSVVIDGVDDH